MKQGALIMEAASTSEISFNFYQTTQSNNPENSHLQSRCCLYDLLKQLKNFLKARTTVYLNSRPVLLLHDYFHLLILSLFDYAISTAELIEHQTS
jgi:hypothetical protein